jgi:hypothetical protein
MIALFNWRNTTMAAKKAKYANVDEAAAFLKSEGFEFVKMNGRWEVDMSNDGGGKECALIEPHGDGVKIVDWHQD